LVFFNGHDQRASPARAPEANGALCLRRCAHQIACRKHRSLSAERSAPRAAARRQGHDCARCLGLAVGAAGSFVLRHHAHRAEVLLGVLRGVCGSAERAACFAHRITMYEQHDEEGVIEKGVDMSETTTKRGKR